MPTVLLEGRVSCHADPNGRFYGYLWASQQLARGARLHSLHKKDGFI